MYGMDPDAMLETIRKSEVETARIESEFETIKAGFRSEWTLWLREYKRLLSN